MLNDEAIFAGVHIIHIGAEKHAYMAPRLSVCPADGGVGAGMGKEESKIHPPPPQMSFLLMNKFCIKL